MIDPAHLNVSQVTMLWEMARKDLRQLLDSPSRFDVHTDPQFGSGTNLSSTIVAMAILEAMATLANVSNSIGGRDDRFATDVVVAFGDRYLARVNRQYAVERPGESLVRLIWDGFRNGTAHRFPPKGSPVDLPGGGQAHVQFGVAWAQNERSLTLDEVRAARRPDGSLGPPHLSVRRLSVGSQGH